MLHDSNKIIHSPLEKNFTIDFRLLNYFLWVHCNEWVPRFHENRLKVPGDNLYRILMPLQLILI